jgi:hypothetical protein
MHQENNETSKRLLDKLYLIEKTKSRRRNSESTPDKGNRSNRKRSRFQLERQKNLILNIFHCHIVLPNLP